MKKLTIGLALTLVGVASIAMGFVGIYNQTANPIVTDEQIIKRARDLGMVHLKEAITEAEQTAVSGIE